MMRQGIICGILMLTTTIATFGQVEVIRKLEQDLPRIKDSTRYVDALNKIAMLSYERNVDSTFVYTLLAHQISTRLKYERGLADATNNLGVVWDIKGNVQMALKYYNAAYNRYRLLGDSSNIVQTLMNIGQVYGTDGQDQKAIANMDQAMLLGSKLSHDSITAFVIYNYILFYPEKFKDAEKQKYLDRAEKIGLKYKDNRMQLAIGQLRGDGLINKGRRAEGIALLEKTKDKALEMQLYYFSMDLLIKLGDLYLPHDREKGISYIQKALEITEQKGYRLYAIVICKKMYDLYVKTGDHAKAYVYTRKLVKLYEDQTELDKISGIDYIEYAVKEQQLASSEIKSAYNTRLLWLAVAVCGLTILSIIFLFRNWTLTKKTNEVLTLQFRQLESTTEALEQSNQNYARLIKVVAHDLRNPIGAINSLSSMLLEGTLDREETKEFTELIYDSSNSCMKLIGDLLDTDFHVSESELVKEDISLVPFLQQTVKMLSFRAAEKNQEITLKDPVDATIHADRDKLSRVLNNLIVNAIKFSPDGGSVEIATEKSTEGVIISVKDNGLGIPKEFASKIFDPFTNTKRAGTAGEKPFGLGLYITKQIVEAHHGRIWFESDGGTVFFVLLPV